MDSKLNDTDSKLRATGRNLLVELLPNNTSAGGIILPESKDKMRRGRVISAGPGCWDSGIWVENLVNEGAIIHFSTWVVQQSATLFVLRDTDALAYEAEEN